MKKSSPSSRSDSSAVTSLFDRVANIVESARGRVLRAVNHETVTTYWLIGREIVQMLQRGEARAQYGNAVITDLAARLTEHYGAGFSVANLKNFRQFYLTYTDQIDAISHPSGSQLAAPVSASEISSPTGSELPPDFHPSLSWSHYRALMRVDNRTARQFYETEAVQANWSRRDLERQINSLFYERLLASTDKATMLEGVRQNTPTLTSLDMLKDPYVLEFLDLPQVPQLYENQLEQAIIDKLQHFLLELGRGFSFVARQKRMCFDDKDFYVDLVFYNYLLKCFVLIDLKIGELTHQDIGQMDGYVRMFEAHSKVQGDNPTIGLILCSEKNAAVARYSVLSDSQQLFAAKYQFTLPSEETLQREIQRERALIENQLES
ncbi:MAG: PDDEXK nuclease domain-containing protein [Nitrosospira sp.]|nr:PDDEXK nuclease domain-containing protein [Nitrosospira sp.]MDN5936461.1 PDDEXK nuclease domain-containing protein [Nitrosospira sp.]